MKLFHVSEESNIKEFAPRKPARKDLDQTKGLVWAITEKCLPNFLTPRNCPRIAYHANMNSSADDIQGFFSSSFKHCVVIENDWFEKMMDTTLYIYEFDSGNFYLQDQVAGYYVSEKTEIPVSITKIDNLFSELFKRNVEVRIVDNLWNLAEKVKLSSLNWSLCRMAYAKV